MGVRSTLAFRLQGLGNGPEEAVATAGIELGLVTVRGPNLSALSGRRAVRASGPIPFGTAFFRRIHIHLLRLRSRVAASFLAGGALPGMEGGARFPW